MNDDTTRLIHEAISWDDRKTLAELFQDSGARFPIAGLSGDLYSALLAVAAWGARQVIECHGAGSVDAATYLTRSEWDKLVAERDRAEAALARVRALAEGTEQ